LYNEADTRAKLIDPRLHADGWDEERIKREHYFTKGQIYLVGDRARRGQPLKADYLLRYSDALPLAVVEAKEEKLKPAAGLQQAKQYAEQLGLLFAYSSNGHGIEEFDFSTQTQRGLDAFPTPDELYDRYTAANPAAATAPGIRRAAERGATYLDPLVAPYYEGDGKRPRYYQEIAINKAVGAIAAGERRVLLTMATGTGKTYMALQIAWKLSRAGRAAHPVPGRPHRAARPGLQRLRRLRGRPRRHRRGQGPDDARRLLRHVPIPLRRNRAH